MTTKAPMSVMYSKVEQSTPAVTTQVVFIPDNQVNFSYTTTQNIHIPIRTAVENAFMDGRSSFLRFTVENNESYDITMDGLASCLFKRLTITAGGQTIQNLPEYNRLCELLQKHFSSDDYFNEMGILSGARLEHEANYSLFTSDDKKGNNTIPAKGKKQYTIPLLSGFLMTKLLPLCFMSVANLNIELLLDDPRNAFIAKHEATPTMIANETDPTKKALLQRKAVLPNALNKIPDINIKQVEYVATIISLRDNDLVKTIANIMSSEGLYINACDYAVYQNALLGNGTLVGGSGSFDTVIPDRSQSTKAFLNCFYRQQPSIHHTNLQSMVAGTTGYSMEIGGVSYPQGRNIEYNTDGRHPSFIHPYLEFQKLVSGGYFNTNTHTNINLTTFTRQNVNNIETNPEKDGKVVDDDVSTAGAVNTCYEGSFVQTMCVENFHGMGGTESGLNTALLNVPIVFRVTRDISTFKDTDLTDSTKSATHTAFPNMLMNTYVLYDVVYKLDNTGLWTVMK